MKSSGTASRAMFWRFCVSADKGSQIRARKRGLPHTIDQHYIDQLLVDQGWKCAVSGIQLNAPIYRADSVSGRGIDPFGPSLDRIKPEGGYVPGNVRIVCNIVNSALSDWGMDALITLVSVMAKDGSAATPAPRKAMSSRERSMVHRVAWRNRKLTSPSPSPGSRGPTEGEDSTGH